MAAVVIRLEDGYRDEPDCAVVALAMYLDVPYASVIWAVAALDRARGKDGLSRRGLVRVAAALGYALKRRRLTDPEDSYGILVAPEHAAVLLDGRVLDRLTNWPLDASLAHQQCSLSDCDYYVETE